MIIRSITCLNVKNLFTNTIVKSRKFSTTQKRQFIPPLTWLIIKPISKFAAIIIGRGSRKWWSSLRPHLTSRIIISHLNRNKVKYSVGVSTVSLSGYIFYYTHLQTTPITNRERFILFLPFQMEEVEELSKSAFKDEYSKKIITKQTKEVNRVMKVLDRIVKSNKDIFEIRNVKWTITLVDDSQVNAAAYPSGHIIVYKGLLDYVDSDDELAGVLGHEISHAILQHTAENLSRSAIIDVLSVVLVLTIWTIVPSDIAAIFVQYFSDKFLDLSLELPFSRFLEEEADKVGLHLAAKACYDVRSIPIFWRRQHLESENLPEIFSTHPAHIHRASDIEKMIPEALKLREQCNCYRLPEKIQNKRNL